MANKEVDNLQLLVAPIGADIYAAKTNTDYRIRAGEANGLATLGADGKVPGAQMTALVWGGITGTLSSQTDLQSALSGKQPAGSYSITDHTHTFASITGKPTTLAGYGITDGGGAAPSWGSIGGTLSSQTDLQAALNGKQAAGSYQPAGSYAAAVHTHTMSQITDAGTWATKNQTVSTAAASGTPADGAVWLQYTA